MNNWFNVKIKYTKQLENGAFKRVSEPYLFAAMTFTDAEARVYEELGAVIKGDLNVTNISRADYEVIFYYDDADAWYKCKVVYESPSDDGDKVKKVSKNFLVAATSVNQAYERIQESLSSLMIDFNIPSIAISPIIDIFPYNEELDREISRRPAEEAVPENPSNVYSDSGSDVDDEIPTEESNITDEYSEENE